ncbi:hypothetical protein BJX63DRAFT_418018 [Aspergillus granulosus]|uniref:Major facilitator superfamily (MFS) profile domain-containing protein n=1 Tax=Aspergillus granulosus TaxID=176169 RepID=A0ABR4I1L7_9EURO
MCTSNINRYFNPLRLRFIHQILPFATTFYTDNLSRVVDRDVFIKGVYLARDPQDLAGVPGLTGGEQTILNQERDLNPFQQTKTLKVIALVTACAAISQGWQQSSINASSPRWQDEIRGPEYWIHQRILAGLIDAAPWLSGSLFGIFVGFLCVFVADMHWGVILGTAAVPSLILLFIVFLCPESPRFLIRKDKYEKAFISLRELRGSDILACRDLYYIHSHLQYESQQRLQRRQQQDLQEDEWLQRKVYQENEIATIGFLQRFLALWSDPRNRRACLAASLVMASQQLCGVSYPVNPRVAWLNFGFGLANFIFTIPAYFYIDEYRDRGRRILLPRSLGGMFVTLSCISSFFFIDDTDVRLGLVSTFTIVIFLFFYGIGAGPVPFAFSAEVFPLAFREAGMSFSVMVNFLGLGLLVLFVPAITHAFGDNGNAILLFIFTGLDAIAFILVFLFVSVPSTGKVTLESMDEVFNKPTRALVKEHLAALSCVGWSQNETQNGIELQ